MLIFLTSCQNVRPHPVVLMMDLYSSLIQRKTYRTVLLVDGGLGLCACVCVFMCVYVKDRVGEREMQWRVREIIFCSVSLCGCLCPSSFCCHGNSHQIRTSAVAFISRCPRAAHRLSVYINCVMKHHRVQPLLAILISGHIQQDSMITYTAERVWEASWFEKQQQQQQKKWISGLKTVSSSQRCLEY